MEVILKEDIVKLGYKNDLVDVKPGFARNFLIPQGLAVVATTGEKKQLEENLKQAAHKEEKNRKDAEAIAQKIEKMKLEIPAKVGETGKIFGAITSLQIADSLKEKGIEIDRKRVSFKGSIKEVGDYVAIIDLYKNVKAEVNFSVVPA